jgi:hypothetical protein
MDDFLLYLELGLNHVLDFQGYDHILFLLALLVVFSFKQLRQVIYLVSLFTLGHTLTLALAAYGVLRLDIPLVEWLIPITIAISCVTNILRASKPIAPNKLNINLFYALVFGLIHGLGFSNYFRMIIGKTDAKFLPLIEFALGIELAQVIIVLVFLTLWALLTNLTRINRRDWILVISSIILGVVLPMILERWPA